MGDGAGIWGVEVDGWVAVWVCGCGCVHCVYTGTRRARAEQRFGVVGKPSEGGVGEEADAGEGGEGAQTTGEHLEQLRSPFKAWLVLARIIA